MSEKQSLLKKPREYDYASVLYPQGNMGDGSIFLFNHDDIKEVLFIGYDTEERKGFLNQLSKLYENSSEV